MIKIRSIKRIKNGGIEQGIMEIAEKMGLLSDKDKETLAHLQSLPPNRTEITGEYLVYEKEDI